MSGSGNRFLKAGYADPKPLIKVNGRPIIEYVIDLFPDEDDFIFICRDEHLRTTNMREVLLNLKPNAKIIEVEPAKLGPVYAVSKAFEFIADDEPVIVNYCDFFMDWDYTDFKLKVQESQCDGNVVSYIGFHPHLLHTENYYASTKIDSEGNMIEIKEKFSYTQDKMKSPQSGGTYYFRKGEYVKKYFTQFLNEGVCLNGEYYVSLVYNLLKRDGLKIHVYDKVKHFCQWGTPEDLKEYLYWESICSKMIGRETGR